ncbi:MAG: putative 7-carboxy-7-deazaguanine synthase QueE [Vulcanibacillus sp.]
MMLKGDMKYKIAEKFVSINGEGKSSGQLSTFIRFAGCNLNCSYCDTKWVNQPDVEYELMTAEEIYKYIKETGIINVTITGGEPLIQNNIFELIKSLSEDNSLNIEIETNGSVSIEPYMILNNDSFKFTMDYKLPFSTMENRMLVDNFWHLRGKDTVKFVVSNLTDLLKAEEIISKYRLVEKTNVYFSPVYGQISLTEIVDFMKDKKMNKVNLQVQLHKIIWGSETKGV